MPTPDPHTFEAASSRRDTPTLTNVSRLVSWGVHAAASRVGDAQYDEWHDWARRWLDGERSPGACVAVASWCFEHRPRTPVFQALGQLAWAGKEACYNTPASGWLAVRYVADAMIVFNVAFPALVDEATSPRRPALPARMTSPTTAARRISEARQSSGFPSGWTKRRPLLSGLRLVSTSSPRRHIQQVARHAVSIPRRNSLVSLTMSS